MTDDATDVPDEVTATIQLGHDILAAVASFRDGNPPPVEELDRLRLRAVAGRDRLEARGEQDPDELWPPLLVRMSSEAIQLLRAMEADDQYGVQDRLVTLWNLYRELGAMNGEEP